MYVTYRVIHFAYHMRMVPWPRTFENERICNNHIACSYLTLITHFSVTNHLLFTVLYSVCTVRTVSWATSEAVPAWTAFSQITSARELQQPVTAPNRFLAYIEYFNFLLSSSICKETPIFSVSALTYLQFNCSYLHNPIHMVKSSINLYINQSVPTSYLRIERQTKRS